MHNGDLFHSTFCTKQLLVRRDADGMQATRCKSRWWMSCFHASHSTLFPLLLSVPCPRSISLRLTLQATWKAIVAWPVRLAHIWFLDI